MASEVSIVNIALGYLGVEQISSLSEDNDVYVNYPTCRDACLEEADWSFAKGRRTLTTPDSEPPDFGYSNRFLLPANVLRVIEVNEDKYPWEVEGRYILTDMDRCDCRWIQRVTDVNSFSSVFIQALAARLAAILAIPKTNSKSVAENYWSLYAALKGVGVGTDGIQGSAKAHRVKNSFRSRR